MPGRHTRYGGNIIDAKVARGLIERLRSNPEAHDQDVWAKRTDCGTVMCAAGHICDIAGAQFEWDGLGQSGYVFLESLPDYYPEASGKSYIPFVAQRILGVNGVIRDRLFFDAKTLEDIEAILWPLIHAAERGESEMPDFTGDEGE